MPESYRAAAVMADVVPSATVWCKLTAMHTHTHMAGEYSAKSGAATAQIPLAEAEAATVAAPAL